MQKFLTILLFSVLFQSSLWSQSGLLDTTFGTDGIATLSPGSLHDVVYDVDVQTDQKLVFTGVARITSSSGFTSDLVIGRLDNDGNLDPSFATNGIYNLASAGGSVFGYDLKIQPDGKIVVCGGYSVTASDTEFIVVRLNADGTPDESFGGGDGISIMQVDTGEDYAYELELLADGKMLLAGTSAVPGFTYSRGIVMQLLPDGSLDETFGSSGYTSVQLDNTSSENFRCLELLPSGKFIAAGYSYVDFEKLFLVGFNADGALDLSFADNGIHVGQSISEAFDMVVSGNAVYVGGRISNTGGFDVGISCFDTNGGLNTTFGVEGTVVANYNPLDCILGLHAQADGKIIGVGTTGMGGFGNRDMLATRYLPSGELDASFGSGGYTVIPVTNMFEEAGTVTQQADGRIIMAGFAAFTNNNMVFIRLTNEQSSGIETIVASHEVTVYPVPVVGSSIWLKSDVPLNGEVECKLMDLRGRSVAFDVLYQHNTIMEFTLPSDLMSGCYLLYLHGESIDVTFPIIK